MKNKVCRVCGGDSSETDHIFSAIHKSAVLGLKLDAKGFKRTNYRDASRASLLITSLDDLNTIKDEVYISAFTGYFDGELFKDFWLKV